MYKVIYHYRVLESKVPLQRILALPQITHVCLTARHPFDLPSNDPRLKDAAKIARASGKPWILMRSFWPLGKMPGHTDADFFSAEYYTRQRLLLALHAAMLGAPETALDFEAYASPVKQYLGNTPNLTAEQFSGMMTAIGRVLAAFPAATYVMPGTCPIAGHPYKLLALLGRNLITEETYYDRDVKVSGHYDVAGLFVVPTPKIAEPGMPKRFTIAEIFKGRKFTLNGPRDVYLFMLPGDVEAVVKEMEALVNP